MRGRKPMPAERATRLGNPNHRPIPKTLEVVALDSGSTPAPAPVHLQKAGKELWASVHRFASTWVIPELDNTVLIMACEVADDRERLKRVLKRDGHFQSIPITTSRGEVVGNEIKIHPARRELRQADVMYLKLLSVLGLTPTDRSRLKLTQAQAENEFDKWLSAHS